MNSAGRVRAAAGQGGEVGRFAGLVARLAAGLAAGAALLLARAAGAAEKVTVDDFVRAETDSTMARAVSQGAFGRFVHVRTMVSLDRQDVIRMNRDTLYSTAVFDLGSPVTIVKPDPGRRFQSMLVINQDHSMQPVEHAGGRFTLTQEQVGTRYAIVLLRTFADPNDPADLQAAHRLQDAVQVEQRAVGSFSVPDWDEASLRTLHDAINVLAATKQTASEMFGDKSKLNPIDHLLGTAYGWGGNPRTAAVYQNGVVERNDGSTPHVLKVRDVPVDGFWSITVYNAKGFMEPNALNASSVNNVTAKPDSDGGYTVHFGGDPASRNHLPITPGWNYVVRMYQPRAAVVDGPWHFPAAQVAP